MRTALSAILCVVIAVTGAACGAVASICLFERTTPAGAVLAGVFVGLAAVAVWFALRRVLHGADLPAVSAVVGVGALLGAYFAVLPSATTALRWAAGPQTGGVPMPTPGAAWGDTFAVVAMQAATRADERGPDWPSEVEIRLDVPNKVAVRLSRFAPCRPYVEFWITQPEYAVLNSQGTALAGEGVSLEMQGIPGESHAVRRAKWTLDPYQRPSDRRWHRVVVPGPPNGDPILVRVLPGPHNNVCGHLWLGGIRIRYAIGHLSADILVQLTHGGLGGVCGLALSAISLCVAGRIRRGGAVARAASGPTPSLPHPRLPVRASRLGAGLVVFSLALVLLLPGAGELGFYADDASFLVPLHSSNLAQLSEAVWKYVPGRNLHILWQWLLFRLGGETPETLGRLHVAQSVLSALTAVGLWLLFRRLGIPTRWAFVGAMLFLVYPNHTETHFWLSAAPMNLVSTLFLLALAHVCAMRLGAGTSPNPRSARTLAVATAVCFGAAAFTYDQPLPLGACLAVVAILAGWRIQRLSWWATATEVGVFALFLAVYGWIRTHGVPGGYGPMMPAPISVEHVLGQARDALINTLTPFHFAADRFDLSDVRAAVLHKPSILFFVAGVAAVYLVLWRLEHDSPDGSATTPRIVILCVLIAIGVSAAALSYAAPVLWYISDRHNYLATLPIALAFVASAILLVAIARRCARVVAVFVEMLLCAGILCFVSAGAFVLADSRDAWVMSYQIRTHFYAQIIDDERIKTARALVLEGFPMHFQRTPLFAYESPMSLNYLSRGASSVEWITESAVDVDCGRYFNLSAWKWAPSSIWFTPFEQTVRLRAKTEAPVGGSIPFEWVHQPDELRRWQSVTPVDASDVPASTEGLAVTSIAASPPTFDVSVPAALLSRVREGSAALRIFSRTGPDGEWEMIREPDASRKFLPVHLFCAPRALSDAAGPAAWRIVLSKIPQADALRFEFVECAFRAPIPLATADIELGPADTGKPAEEASEP